MKETDRQKKEEEDLVESSICLQKGCIQYILKHIQTCFNYFN